MRTVHEAHVIALEGLLIDLEHVDDSDLDPPCTSASYLRDFIGRAILSAPDMPIDKLGRWTGFVQGVMAARGLISVQGERDRTRELFSPTRVGKAD